MNIKKLRPLAGLCLLLALLLAVPTLSVKADSLAAPKLTITLLSPIEIVSQSSDYVRLFVVIGAVILICMVALGVLISKIKISQALKLGED